MTDIEKKRVLWAAAVLFSVFVAIIAGLLVSKQRALRDARQVVDVRLAQVYLEHYFSEHGAYPDKAPQNNVRYRYQSDSKSYMITFILEGGFGSLSKGAHRATPPSSIQ